MLTFYQKKLAENPLISELISRLDAVPITPDIHTKISSRIDSWINTAPLDSTPRHIIKDQSLIPPRKPWDTVDNSSYPPGYCPF